MTLNYHLKAGTSLFLRKICGFIDFALHPLLDNYHADYFEGGPVYLLILCQ